MSNSMICKTCGRPLEVGRDSRRGGLWKNCQRCRDKNTSSKRRKRGLSPVNRQDPLPVYGSRPFTAPRVDGPRYTTPSASSSMGYVSPPHSSARLGPRPSSTFNSQRLNNEGLFGNLSSALRDEVECTVCGDTVSSTQFPRLEECSHEPRVCRGCLSDWLTSQVGSTSWNRIVCPSEGCGVLVDHDQMKEYASAETFTRSVLQSKSFNTRTDIHNIGTMNCLPAPSSPRSLTSATACAPAATLAKSTIPASRATYSAA